MKFAYADPPYIGQARKHYGKEDTFAGEVDHAALLQRLYEEYPDGWALSASMVSLWDLMPMIPRAWKCRVAAWCKTYVTSFPGVSPLYAWEPVIFRGGRRLQRQSWKDGVQPTRDWLVSANVTVGAGKTNGQRHGGLHGRKPEEFCYWIFEVLNMRSGDQLDDLFPGTGGVTRAWKVWSDALPLFRGIETDG